MPDPDPAPDPHPHPPPWRSPQALLALLSVGPAMDVISTVTASPRLAALAAQVAHLALLAPALALAVGGR
ncbi:MAG: hypothetical protein ABSH51_28670 [Solirubrobacteraceae bacterium]|jgi:hypothetical protein